MKKVYIDLPTLCELKELIRANYVLSDTLADADVLISEHNVSFAGGKLVITLCDSPNPSPAISISPALSPQTMFHAIKSAVDTYFLMGGVLNPSYNSLKDSNPKAGYLAKKLENIINSAVECILEIDSSGKVLFHNKKFAATYDSVNAIFEGSLFEVFEGDTAQEVKKIIAEIKPDSSAEFSGRMRTCKGSLLPVEGYIAVLSDNIHYEVVFVDVTEKLLRRQQLKKSEEQAIVAGFARHLSHNVMNALTAAGGFIKKVQAKTENSLYTQNLWHIINDKLMLIEEIVAGYNDYTHATALRKTETIDLSEFFQNLVKEIHAKTIDRSFTAYLYKLTDNYNLSYDFSQVAPFMTEANRMFLKLAFCYILKDNIRYFSGNLPIEYKITLQSDDDSFSLSIIAVNVDVSEQIVDTMLKPWDHKMLSQSFDYWGIMIAAAVIEKHNGKVFISRDGSKLRFDLVFYKS